MIRRQIPNLITLCNLLCGVIASYVAVTGQVRMAALFICLGILFDFFDGLAARLLGVSSPMGKELDSLADVVTSGVAPAMIMLRLLADNAPDPRVAAVAFLIPLFSAYRLAKFNLDTRQSHSFLGLPVPSQALVWVGIAASGHWLPDSWPMVAAFVVLSLVLDVLMVSELPLFSLKFNFRDLSWRTNSVQYLFLAGCALIIALLRDWIAVSFIIIWYIILSAITRRRHAQ